MNAIHQVLCVGVRPGELGIGDAALLAKVELDYMIAPDAPAAKALLMRPERWDLLLCDAARFYDLAMDRRLVECADRLTASVVLLRAPFSLLTPADAAARGAADVVAYGDREHLAAVAARELAAGSARKQLRQLQQQGADGKRRVSVAKITDLSSTAVKQDAAARGGPAPVAEHAQVRAGGDPLGGTPPIDAGAVREFTDSVSVGDTGATPTLPELDDEMVRSRIEAGGLTLEYQPIVPLSKLGEQWALFEVLSRLRDENGLVLPPRRFFPAIARNQWLGHLDLWVFRRALPILARVQETNRMPTRFYINLSPTTLSEPAIVQAILDAVDKANIRPESLVIEIRNESLDAPETLAPLAECLGQHGHKMLLEEFGSEDCPRLGRHLKWLTQVKLDTRLLEQLEAGKIKQSDARRVVLCAQNNGVKVIGMAVDNAALLARLYDIGVDYIQGHFVSMPYGQLVYPDVHDIEVTAGPLFPAAPLPPGATKPDES